MRTHARSLSLFIYFVITIIISDIATGGPVFSAPNFSVLSGTFPETPDPDGRVQLSNETSDSCLFANESDRGQEISRCHHLALRTPHV